jgi:SpoIID/LytB domain protein
MSALSRVRLRLAFIPMLVVAVVAGFLLVEAPAARADGDITFSGHGFGHGRGMSQYGAYGYAVDQGATYANILDHYYRGTTLAGNAGNPVVSVELLGLRGLETIITGPRLMLNGAPLGRTAIRIRGVAANTFEITVGDTCAGPWTYWTGAPGGIVGNGTTVSDDVRLCTAGGVRAYRGSMVVLDGGGYGTTINYVTIDDYLRGVVPSEMPAGWGSAGGGKGMEALKVQAVAARSYALSSQWKSYANTCDTTSCQVYGGAYNQPNGGALNWVENSLSDQAVAATSGQVRRWPNGSIARTEFGSSSGGWTAGGDFQAVQDGGDGTALNPNKNWAVTLTRATVAARLGIASINGVRVTERNGLGAEGGRVLKMVFDTSAGPVTKTGNEVRSALGLKSDWFSISTITLQQAQAFTQALYADVLGRPVDPGGLAGWSNQLTGGADPYAVAYAVVNSTERYQQMIYQAYVYALHRGPDPAGNTNWLNLLVRGGTLNDLNAMVYGSRESFIVLGGGNAGQWVEGVYQGLLGRSASPAERTSWGNLANQVGASAVVMAISTSAEARYRRLAQFYWYLLGRQMDDGGRDTYAPSLAQRGDTTVPALIAASAEYRARAEARYP